jgi:protein translocase SecG subunit
MELKTVLLVLELVFSITLVALILIQPKASGGLTRSWGSTASFTRRGLEQVIFRGTFVVSGLFIIVSALQLII